MRSAATTASAVAAPVSASETASTRVSAATTIDCAITAAATTPAAAGSARGIHGRLCAEPGDRALEAFAQRRARLEAEQLPRAGRVERAARLAVRHRRVPDDLAREARQLGDQLGGISDRRLDAGPEVDRVAAVVALGGEREPLGGVVHVQELAR